MKFLNNYKRTESTRIRKFNNEYYVISCEKTYKINEIGVVILKYLGTRISTSELADKILSKYSGVEHSKICQDIEEFIKFLISENIIMEVENEL